jgi:hypothetical protein
MHLSFAISLDRQPIIHSRIISVCRRSKTTGVQKNTTPFCFMNWSTAPDTKAGWLGKELRRQVFHLGMQSTQKKSWLQKWEQPCYVVWLVSRMRQWRTASAIFKRASGVKGRYKNGYTGGCTSSKSSGLYLSAK